MAFTAQALGEDKVEEYSVFIVFCLEYLTEEIENDKLVLEDGARK